MTEIISPARQVRGAISVPGDKSISHRMALLTSIAEGESHILNYSTGADCQSTLACLSRLGVRFEHGEREGRAQLTVHGLGLRGLQASSSPLDAGNSGSTIRMLSGILAGQAFQTEIFGDESLSRRPMMRVINPLRQMGAQIEATNEQYPPLRIHGGRLTAIEYKPPVASAQVKSCVLLAGLYAEGQTSVEEPVRTRDHTEILLRELGADLSAERKTVKVRGGRVLHPADLVVPGDLSSAAFFLVAALVAQEAELVIANVGLNPTRTVLLDFLKGQGAQIEILEVQSVNGELVGNLRIRSSSVKGGQISGALTAALIDEIPVLAVLGALSESGLTVSDATELRVKETDRIATVVDNLRRMGVAAEAQPDGLTVPGRQKLRAAEIDSFGDHRIAMAFSIAALAADGACTIRNPEAASVSYPEFYRTLREIAQ